MKKFMLITLLSLTTLFGVGCSALLGVDDADLLYQSSRVIITEYNSFLRGERTRDFYTDEELAIKIRRNDEYLKFIKELHKEAKDEQAALDKKAEEEETKEAARKEQERQEVIAILRRQLADAQAKGDTAEVARLQGLLNLVLGAEGSTTPDEGSTTPDEGSTTPDEGSTDSE